MSMTCTVCRHKERDRIDRLLVMGTSERAVAGEFGLMRSSVHRHRLNHLPEKLLKAKDAHEIAQADSLVAENRAFIRRLNAIADQGVAGPAWKRVAVHGRRGNASTRTRA